MRPVFSSIRKHFVNIALLIGYVYMALLVVEQNRTIENQQSLIRTLFFDSSQLNAMRMQKVAKAYQKALPPQ